MRKGAKGLAIGTVIAGIAGYVAGMLTAPKSGRETRERIKTSTNTSITQTEKQLKQLHTELNDLLTEAKAQGQQAKGQAAHGLQEATDFADKTRSKVREILSAVHEGDTDDKDLQKAVKEAKKAIDSVQKYLKK